MRTSNSSWKRGADLDGELTHSCEPDQVMAEGLAAGFSDGEQWVERGARFALTRFDVDD